MGSQFQRIVYVSMSWQAFVVWSPYKKEKQHVIGECDRGCLLMVGRSQRARAKAGERGEAREEEREGRREGGG